MLGTPEDGRGAHLIGGARGWDDEADVVIALVGDLVDAVMQHADADGALTDADGLGGTGAALGVLGDVLVEVHQVLDARIVAVLLDDGVDEQLGRTRRVVVG